MIINQSRSIAAALAGLFILGSQACFAETPPPCPAEATHCLHVSGIHNTPLDKGIYIKFESTEKGQAFSYVSCTNQTNLMTISQEIPDAMIGQHTMKLSYCESSSGQNCIPVGVDNFKITKNNGKYTSKPFYTVISLPSNAYTTRCSIIR